MARSDAPPAPPPPFPRAFRELLPRLLATRGPIDAGRVERMRARRAVLSQSGTFVGHRPYERGDDLRHLDWAAYARTGELYTKQLQEEDRRAVTLVLDLSPRLLAGTPPRLVGVQRLAAVLGGLALARLDGVAVVAVGAPQPNARFVGQAQLPRLLQFLEELPAAAGESPGEAPAQAAALALQGDATGRVHWISDFAQPSRFVRPLLQLRRRGVKLTGWLPTVPEDEEPPAGGYLRVRDPETLRQLDVPIDRALRDELRRQLALLVRQQRRMFAEVGAALVRWPFANTPLAEPRLQDHLPIVAACSRGTV